MEPLYHWIILFLLCWDTWQCGDTVCFQKNIRKLAFLALVFLSLSYFARYASAIILTQSRAVKSDTCSTIGISYPFSLSSKYCLQSPVVPVLIIVIACKTNLDSPRTHIMPLKKLSEITSQLLPPIPETSHNHRTEAALEPAPYSLVQFLLLFNSLLITCSKVVVTWNPTADRRLYYVPNSLGFLATL